MGSPPALPPPATYLGIKVRLGGIAAAAAAAAAGPVVGREMGYDRMDCLLGGRR